MRLLLSSLFLVMIFGMSALAAPAFVWLPKATTAGESYVPVGFDAKSGTPSAIADEALKKLVADLPEAAAIAVKFDATSAELTLDTARAGDPAVADRALGAVYFTLRGAGLDEVRLAGKPLSHTSFTRGAYVAVHSLATALSTKVSGWVEVSGVPVPAASFYKRVDSGDKDVFAAVKAALEDAPADVRLMLIEKIDTLKSKEKEALVLGRLEDGDARVRKAAVAHLTKPSANGVKGLQALVDRDTDNGVRLDAVKILVASGKKEYERYLLLDKLNANDPNAVIEAARGLAASKDKKFMPAIAGLAAHGNPQVRAMAVTLLKDAGELGLVAQIPNNEQLAADVRELAAKTAAEHAAGADKASGLSWLIEKGSADNAVWAAAMVRDQVVLGTAVALGKALARPEAEVRKTAAQALGKLKDPVGLEPLAQALRASSDAAEKELYANEASAIIAIQPVDQAIAIAGSKDATVRELAIRALAGFSKDKPNAKVNDVLKKALSEKDPGTRQAAAFALARVNDDGVVADLAKLDGDADPEIRAQVAVAIGRSKVAAHDALLIKFLDDKENAVKEAALVAIQAKKLGAAVDKVRFLVANRKPEVRREAMKALVLLAKPADAALFDIYAKAMQDEDTGVRMAALDGLAPFKDGRAAQYIGLPLLDDRAEKVLKLKVIEVLGGLGTADAVEHAVRGLFDEDREVKLATLTALEKLKSDKASRPLQEFILREADAEVKARANAVLELL